MSKLLEQFHADKALRDAAKTVLIADIEHARASISPKGIADRVGGQIGSGAKDVYSVAKTHADDSRGIIAVFIGAVLLWISRDTIMEILGLEDTDAQPDMSDEGEPAPQQPEDYETETTVEAEANPPAPLDESPDGDEDEQ